MRAFLAERIRGQSTFRYIYNGPSFTSTLCHQEWKTSWPQIWEKARRQRIFSGWPIKEEMQKETVPRNPWPIPTRSWIPCPNDWTSSRWRSLSTMWCFCGWRWHSPFDSTIIPLRKGSDFKTHCLPQNVYTKKMKENNSRPLPTGRTNNGSRHRVRPLHGGNGKTPGGLLKIQNVKEEASKVLGKNGETRCLQYFSGNLRRWLSRIQFLLWQIDRLQLTVVYCNRRGV